MPLRRSIMDAMTAFEDLLSELHVAGLWSGVPDDQRRAVTEALGSGDDATWPAGGAWRADGEDLSDGDVEPWLQGMSGSLADCGVDVRVATVTSPHDEGSADYTMSLNGTPLTLYTFVEGQAGLPATEDPWMDCSVGPAAEINRLLEAAGSTRRLALFWPGGNDGFAVLGEQAALLQAIERGAASGSWDAIIP